MTVPDRPSGQGRVVDGQGYTRVRPRESEPAVATSNGGGSTASSTGGGGGGVIVIVRQFGWQQRVTSLASRAVAVAATEDDTAQPR